MRIVFMGTPAFAVPVLAALREQPGVAIAGVYTPPDRPRGRGQELESTPVKAAALEMGLPVFQPASLRPDAIREELAARQPDVIVVAAYGKLLPPEVLALPPHGCLNIHPSLLPKYRGPSPVATAILDGIPVTGVTLMLLDEGMDTGPIIRPTGIPPVRRGTGRHPDQDPVPGRQRPAVGVPGTLGCRQLDGLSPGRGPGNGNAQAGTGRRPSRLALICGGTGTAPSGLHPLARPLHPMARQNPAPAGSGGRRGSIGKWPGLYRMGRRCPGGGS